MKKLPILFILLLTGCKQLDPGLSLALLILFLGGLSIACSAFSIKSNRS